MGTRIKALGTFRNEAKLPNGIVRRGRTVEVADSYAEALVEDGKAEYVEEGSENGESDTSDTSGIAPNLDSAELPEGTPKRSLLKDNEIHTLGDLKYFVEEGLLQNIKGIGPASEDELEAFLEDAISELV